MLFIASWVTRENIAPPYITISELPVGSIVSAYLQTALFSLLVIRAGAFGVFDSLDRVLGRSGQRDTYRGVFFV